MKTYEERERERIEEEKLIEFSSKQISIKI